MPARLDLPWLPRPIRPIEPRISSRARRPARPRLREHRRHKLASRSAIAALVLLAAITGSLAGLTLVYSVDLPQIQDLEQYRPSTITDLYDRKGRIIGSFALQRRHVVGYDDFAPVLRQAVISIEDKNFESHWGINVFRVAGAVWHDIRSHGRAQGASTLTMQLARNLFLTSDRTVMRKLQEAYLAIQIERAFTKQQIFTLYGNQIYLGSGNYGFEAASEYFFSKHARDLTLTEAALLAGLPKGPVAFSPILNPERALRRRNLVLSEMESDGVITHAQAEEARNAPLGLRMARPEGSVAPWFQDEVREELEKHFGTEEVHEAGLRVDTTLDLDLQNGGQSRRARKAWPPTSAEARMARQTGECFGRRRNARQLPPSRLGGDGRTRRIRSCDGYACSSAGDSRAHRAARISRARRLFCCPRTGSGLACATATRWPNPATYLCAHDRGHGKRRAPRFARTGLRQRRAR